MSTGRFTPRSASPAAPEGELEGQLITRLRNLPTPPAPDAQFKADLRSQLVSITSRIVAESTTDESTVGATNLHRRRRAAGAAGVLQAMRRPVLAFGAAATVLVLMLGLAVWRSGGSLPGDSLYGVKRASENVKLSMASGDAAKGRTYLDLATKRAKEVLQLLGQPTQSAGAVNPIDAHTASLVTQTLASADSDSRSGMQLIGRSTVADMSAAPLTKLAVWLPAQRSRLTEASTGLPAGTLRTRAQNSLALLLRIETRAADLKSKIGCPCLAQANSDDLGPVPCSPCKSLSPAPGVAGTAAPSGTVPGVAPPANVPGSGSSSTGATHNGSTSGTAGDTAGGLPGGGTVPGVPLPGVPVPTGAGGATSSATSVTIPGTTITVPSIVPPTIKLPKVLPGNLGEQ
jgi:hypothetical protein